LCNRLYFDRSCSEIYQKIAFQFPAMRFPLAITSYHIGAYSPDNFDDFSSALLEMRVATIGTFLQREVHITQYL
jgi:hypothetical protein